jgi:hypothetical protein
VRHDDHGLAVICDEPLDDVGLREQAVAGVAWLIGEAEAEEVECQSYELDGKP